MIEKRVIPASASPLPSAREHTLASVLPSMASQRKNFAWPAISLRSEGPSYRGRPLGTLWMGSVQLSPPTVCCSLMASAALKEALVAIYPDPENPYPPLCQYR